MELGRNAKRRIHAMVESGRYRTPEEVVECALDALDHEQDALAAEQEAIRGELDRRYDDLKEGRVQPVPGEKVFARIRARLNSSGE